MMYANRSLDYKDHFLFVQYAASIYDFKSIQLYLLFIGNPASFYLTYIISIVAACYGITKFFRLSRAKIIRDKFLTRSFAGTSFLTALYVGAKGWMLASFMLVWQNTMITNVTWWLVFCMLPSFSFFDGALHW